MNLLVELTKVVWECVALSVAYGLIYMAILQFLKDMFWREWFNARQFRKHFSSGEDELATQLIQLAAAGDTYALFGLSIDKLAGQISLAANAVIEAPKRYSKLLALMATGADEKDIQVLVDADEVKLKADALKSESTQAGADARPQVEYADARTRVSHQMQRNIDSLQLSATQRWTRRNQAASVLISILVGLVPLFLRNHFPSSISVLATLHILWLSLVLSFLGGLLAPILRDLAAHASQRD